MAVGDQFIETMKIQLLQGRDFSAGYGADTSNFIINEEAARVMKMKDPVGKEFSYKQTKGKIIGLVKNFHALSLHDPIIPLAMTFQKSIIQGWLFSVQSQAVHRKF